MADPAVLADDIATWTKTDIEHEYGVTVRGYQYTVGEGEDANQRATITAVAPPELLSAEGEVRNVDPLVPLSEAIIACRRGDWLPDE